MAYSTGLPPHHLDDEDHFRTIYLSITGVREHPNDENE
eukprot:CAMPEP_0185259188 /NCGR_PEP_ID=MMETSP1359-20130426/8010_1 /TAXON_ID=552665 /ORGANISM="Bigelowiella longifila, Strain CCMP242" /LENGTH=37 /DNA_ID= /DNA_START= /DNA_END= /DNA_ORIENTATION=